MPANRRVPILGNRYVSARSDSTRCFFVFGLRRSKSFSSSGITSCVEKRAADESRRIWDVSCNRVAQFRTWNRLRKAIETSHYIIMIMNESHNRANTNCSMTPDPSLPPAIIRETISSVRDSNRPSTTTDRSFFRFSFETLSSCARYRV